MANNNVPPTPSTSLPYFVPRIVMIATYNQSTQTPITSTSNNVMQTDTSTFNTSATQQYLSKVIKQLRPIYHIIPKLFKQTLELMKI